MNAHDLGRGRRFGPEYVPPTRAFKRLSWNAVSPATADDLIRPERLAPPALAPRHSESLGHPTSLVIGLAERELVETGDVQLVTISVPVVEPLASALWFFGDRHQEMALQLSCAFSEGLLGQPVTLAGVVRETQTFSSSRPPRSSARMSHIARAVPDRVTIQPECQNDTGIRI